MEHKSNLYYIWKEGERFKVSDNFMNVEFECPYTEGMDESQMISKILVDKLQLIRRELNLPITITSGYRTKAHNEYLKSMGYQVAEKSQHLLGNAVDVTCRDMKELERLCHKYFDAVGVSDSFIHIDIRDDKKRHWIY